MKTTRLAVIALALAAATGCVDNNASVQIHSMCAPPEADACVFEPECDAQYIGVVSMDLAITSDLWVFLQVNNQLPSNEDLSSGRVNTNDAYVDEYEVEFEGIALPKVERPLRHPAIVEASGSRVISAFPIEAPAVGQPDLAALLRAAVPDTTAVGPVYVDIVAEYRLKGRYNDQSTFETAPFRIPIRLCDGCMTLVGCTAPDLLAMCPPGAQGQRPASAACVTP